jgi:SAM-dependent methyltransferase
MKFSLSDLFRRRKKRPAPRPQAASAQKPKTADELRRELRSAIERCGQGYFEFGEIACDEAVADCRVFANRHKAIESLPAGGTIAEVGTQTGRFAEHIFRTARPAKLHLFDLSLQWFDQSVLTAQRQDGRVQIHLGDSASELAKFPDEHFDWLYIDGDHSYAGVQRDIAQAVRKVRPDGLLVFNDYTVWSPLEVCNYGVLRAVNELVNTGEWEFVYLALHPWGYHDAALRRRQHTAARQAA